MYFSPDATGSTGFGAGFGGGAGFGVGAGCVSARGAAGAGSVLGAAGGARAASESDPAGFFGRTSVSALLCVTGAAVTVAVAGLAAGACPAGGAPEVVPESPLVGALGAAVDSVDELASVFAGRDAGLMLPRMPVNPSLRKRR